MLYRLLVVILSLCMAIACNEVKVKEGDKDDSASEMPEKGADQGENVDPPSNIAGSFLHCAEELEPSDSNTEALIGCRFDNERGERVAVAAIAETSEFTFRPAPIPSLKVYPKVLNGDNRYDAVYLFVADTKDALVRGMQDTRILVELKNVRGAAANASVSGLVKEVQIDVNAIPEPRQTDYSEVRDEVLIDDGAGELPPPP